VSGLSVRLHVRVRLHVLAHERECVRLHVWLCVFVCQCAAAGAGSGKGMTVHED